MRGHRVEGAEAAGIGGGQRASPARKEGAAEAVAPSRKGQVTAGQWLLSARAPQLRQQEPPGGNMQTTPKICKHHRELGLSYLALGRRVEVQSSRGGTGKASP